MSRASASAVLLITMSACATANLPQVGDKPGATPSTAPNFYADLAWGAGTYKQDIKGGPNGDTDGSYARLRMEYVEAFAMGAGLSLEGAASDDDLYADQGSPDFEGKTGDWFLYFVGVPTESQEFRLPIRLGLYYHYLENDEALSFSEIDWIGKGLRAEVEPEVWILRLPGFSFGFVGELSAGAHLTRIDAEIAGSSERFDGHGHTFGAGLGVQALFGDHVTTKLAYVFRTTSEADSDDEGFVSITGQDVSFSGLALQVGVRF